MSGSTISNSVTFGIVFGTLPSTGTYTSPLTITSAGGVTLSGAGDAIFGDNTQAWAVINQGHISVAGSSGDGIDLRGGGSVNNSGQITGLTGIYIAGTAGTVTNSGTIDGTGTGATAGVVLEAGGTVDNIAGLIEGYRGLLIVSAAGTVTNSGAIDGTGTAVAVVYLNDGGTVTNSGMIAGPAGGVDIAGTSGGTVVNTGTIQSTGTGAGSTGVSLSGGSITNGASNATAAVIEGVQYGAQIGSAAGTVVNYGTIENTATSGEGLRLIGGGTIDNRGTIEGPSTGIFLDIATSVTNGQSGSAAGYIAGQTAVNMQGPGTITNYGGIAGTAAGSTTGVYMVRGGTVHNYGTITGIGTAGVGVSFGFLNAGAIVVNGKLLSTAALISGSIEGVTVELNGGTVTNYGTINGGADAVNMSGTAGVVVNNFVTLGGGSHGVYLSATGGASVVNSGTMTGGAEGVHVSNASGTVANSGTIEGSTGNAIDLTDGGTVTNHGVILSSGTGQAAINISNAAGSVGNYGSISGGTGVLINQFAGTLTNSGTITGASGTAINFGGSDNLLVLENGYSFGGTITVSGTANTVKLLGTAGAVTLDFDKSGAGFANFGTAAFGANYGNNDILKISDTTVKPGTITSFTSFHDIIDLTQLSPVGATATLSNGNTLVVSNGSQSVSLQLGAGSYGSVVWNTGTDGSGGTNIEPSCFCRGTLILTDKGEVAVEDLTIGDRVVTLSGEAKAIKWIGRRAFDARFVAGNRSILPIRIEAGALADCVPVRDLFVSPEHALHLDGLFLPARLLVNGATIRQAKRVDRLEYFHIEVEAHDIIFAEGAAAETFIAVAGRAIFHNGAEFAALYPDARPADGQSYWALLEEGAAGLPGVRSALLARAAELGRVSGDPDLHLAVDGAIVLAQSVAGHTHRFAVSPDASRVTIASRSVVPAESEAASLDDRRLGVPLQRVVLTGAGICVEIGPDCPALQDGFHRDEGTHRWTDGRGSLPPGLLAGLRDGFAGGFTVEVEIAPIELHYPTDPPPARATVSSDDGFPKAAPRIIS